MHVFTTFSGLWSFRLQSNATSGFRIEVQFYIFNMKSWKELIGTSLPLPVKILSQDGQKLCLKSYVVHSSDHSKFRDGGSNELSLNSALMTKVWHQRWGVLLTVPSQQIVRAWANIFIFSSGNSKNQSIFCVHRVRSCSNLQTRFLESQIVLKSMGRFMSIIKFYPPCLMSSQFDPISLVNSLWPGQDHFLSKSQKLSGETQCTTVRAWFKYLVFHQRILKL